MYREWYGSWNPNRYKSTVTLTKEILDKALRLEYIDQEEYDRLVKEKNNER